jgi:putative ABC transport system permease protein
MFRYHFKIIVRGLFNQKAYSLIKIGGFALGIAACLLIALYLSDELSYDRHYSNGDRIFRVVFVYNDNENSAKGTAFPAPFAGTLKELFPEIEGVGRLNRTEYFGAGSNEIRRAEEQRNAHEEGFAFADQGLLDIFRLPVIYGNPHHVLDEPNTIVLSKRKADKYFPNEDPVGRTVIINNDVSKPYRITGVIDFPARSHLQPEFLFSLAGGLYPGEGTNWISNSYDTYILLKPGTDVHQLETKLSVITTKYLIPNHLASGYAEAEKLAEWFHYELQPVRNIHLKSAGIMDGLMHGDIRFVWLFATVALFIFLLAGINFINLSTAKSASRAREVGLRKTIGSKRINLIRQFLSESLLYSFLSFFAGTLLAALILPYFNTLSAKSLIIPWSAWWWLLPLMLLASAIIGILAGLYPAFYLSSFRPASILKGELSLGSKNARMRSSLVIFQFAVSILLIAGTFVIYRQVGYILNKDLGFKKEQVLLLHGANTLGDQVKTFKHELLKLPEVNYVSVSDYLPVSGTKRDGFSFWNEGKTKVESAVGGQYWIADHDYIKTMGMHIIAGRDFSADMPTDSGAAIINQTLAHDLGLTDPVGKRISTSWRTFEVIGVVEDFHFESLKQDIGGLCIILGNSPDIVSVKVNTSDMAATVQSVTRVWDAFSPNQPVMYSFLDERFASMYADVQRTGRIFGAFALLAIVIACLGLFALSSFMIEQRTKEIGIRKVNGARVSEILAMINADYIKWVAIAFVIACPLAWYVLHKWLQNFAYKTTLSWWIFAAAGTVAVVIALLTVSWQSWRAATRNPVEALRYE